MAVLEQWQHKGPVRIPQDLARCCMPDARAPSQPDDHASPLMRRFESLVSGGDLLEWILLRDRHAAPACDECLVNRVRGLFSVRRREVVAPQEVHSNVLEK